METFSETFKFVDQELCKLKALFESIEQELKDTRNELTKAPGQRDTKRRGMSFVN